MEFKGTKESWTVVYGTDSVWVESELWHIAEVSKKSTLGEQGANAKLIASAPDLLEFALSFSKLLANGDIELMRAKTGKEKEVADMVRLNIKAIEKALK